MPVEFLGMIGVKPSESNAACTTEECQMQMKNLLEIGGIVVMPTESQVGVEAVQGLQNGCRRHHLTRDSPLNFDLTLASLYCVTNG